MPQGYPTKNAIISHWCPAKSFHHRAPKAPVLSPNWKCQSMPKYVVFLSSDSDKPMGAAQNFYFLYDISYKLIPVNLAYPLFLVFLFDLLRNALTVKNWIYWAFNYVISVLLVLCYIYKHGLRVLPQVLRVRFIFVTLNSKTDFLWDVFEKSFAFFFYNRLTK